MSNSLEKFKSGLMKDVPPKLSHYYYGPVAAVSWLPHGLLCVCVCVCACVRVCMRACVWSNSMSMGSLTHCMVKGWPHAQKVWLLGSGLVLNDCIFVVVDKFLWKVLKQWPAWELAVP